MMTNEIGYGVNDAKVDDASISDVEVNRSNRIIFNIESLLYASIVFIIGSPFLIASLISRFAEWVAKICMIVLNPICSAIVSVMRVVGSVIANGIRYIFQQVVRLFKYIWYLYKHINWCLVRSLSRLITIIGTIVAMGFIIKSYMTYAPNVIITGKFMDANSDIVIIHMLMIYVLLNVVIFYFLWFLAPEDEVNAICKYTKQWSDMTSNISKR